MQASVFQIATCTTNTGYRRNEKEIRDKVFFKILVIACSELYLELLRAFDFH